MRPLCHECFNVENCLCIEPKSGRFNQRVINAENPVESCEYFREMPKMSVDFNMNYGYQVEE